LKRIFRILFITYLMVLGYLLFFRSDDYLINGYTLVNLRLFDTIKRYIGIISGEGRLTAVINLFGNIVVFMPVGILLPCICKKADSYAAMLITAITLPVIVETVQYYTRTGVADVDDVLLNFIGIILGFLLYRMVARVKG
jgi:glycopeptide antibiotics resistance protein